MSETKKNTSWLFEVFYRKHKPADVEDSVAMAAKLTADKGFGKIRKALTKKYGDDPLPLWRAAKKAREAAGGKGGGAQGEPEPEAEEDEEEEEEKLPRVIPEGHHQLSATWVAWAQKAPEPGQKRGEAFPIGDFATVEEFWTSWRWVPSPSKAFNQMHRPARERVPSRVGHGPTGNREARPAQCHHTGPEHTRQA